MKELKVIHWDYAPPQQRGYLAIDTELFAKDELYPNTESKIHWRLLIRWVFRAYNEQSLVLSYITEQDFIIVYKKEPDNLNRLKLIISTSHLQCQMEFDNRKKGTLFQDTTLPYYEFPQSELQELIAKIEAGAQRP